MFCPQGYLTLSEIYEILLDAGDKYARENPAPLLDKGSESGFHIDTGVELETKGRAYGEWLLQNFLWQFRTELCASQNTGVVVRLAPATTASIRFFNGPFPDSTLEQEALIKHVGDGLAWIDQYLLQISLSKTYLVLSEEDFGINELAVALKPIEGWIVCWKPPKWPFREQDLVQASMTWQVDGSVGSYSASRNELKRGRPPKGDGAIRRAVKNEYFWRLRKGTLSSDQREATYLEAIEWVERVFEERLGRSTIQKYLAEVFEVLDARK